MTEGEKIRCGMWIKAGQRHGNTLFEALNLDAGAQHAGFFAAGMMQATRDYLVARYGPRSAHELMSGLCEEILDPALSAQFIEREIEQITKRMKRGHT